MYTSTYNYLTSPNPILLPLIPSSNCNGHSCVIITTFTLSSIIRTYTMNHKELMVAVMLRIMLSRLHMGTLT